MGSEKDGEKIYPLGYEPEITPDTPDDNVRNNLLNFILKILIINIRFFSIINHGIFVVFH